jgi:hypothetical protein
VKVEALLFPNAERQGVGSRNYIYGEAQNRGIDCPRCYGHVAEVYVKTLFDNDGNLVKVLPCPRCCIIS